MSGWQFNGSPHIMSALGVYIFCSVDSRQSISKLHVYVILVLCVRLIFWQLLIAHVCRGITKHVHRGYCATTTIMRVSIIALKYKRKSIPLATACTV